MTEPGHEQRRLSRRRLLGSAGAGAAGVLAAGAAGGVIGRATAARRPRRPPTRADDAVAVLRRAPGRHRHARPRTGCTSSRSTSSPTTATELVELLQEWTDGRPPDDRRAGTPGRSARSAASPRRRRTTPARRSACRRRGLTLTIGFGPTLFRDADGEDRFGLAARRPARAGRPAALPRRRARPGDLRRRPLRPGLRQRPAGRRARDPQPGPDRLRAWSACAGRSSASAARRRPRTAQATPRNLLGFKDGTANLKAEDADRCCDQHSGCAPATDRPGWPAAPTWSPARSGC